MLTPRQAQLAFIPLAAATMSGVISLAMTALHRGGGAGLLQAWLAQWPVAFAVALPTALVILPALRALLQWLAREPADHPFGRMG